MAKEPAYCGHRKVTPNCLGCDTYADVDEQLLADYPELKELIERKRG